MASARTLKSRRPQGLQCARSAAMALAPRRKMLRLPLRQQSNVLSVSLNVALPIAHVDASSLWWQYTGAEDLRNLLTKLRPFFALIPKPKTAKIVWSIVDAVAKIP
ncbi:hypothetical protein EJB05_00477, partial [Eragrostis curvula]